MFGVLLIAHGNKRSKATTIMQAIAKGVSDQLPNALVAYWFIWQSNGDLESVFNQFASPDMQEIVIIPYFLFDGVHVTKTVREIAAAMAVFYPQKTIAISNPLGIDPRLAEIVADRIREQRRGHT